MEGPHNLWFQSPPPPLRHHLRVIEGFRTPSHPLCSTVQLTGLSWSYCPKAVSNTSPRTWFFHTFQLKETGSHLLYFSLARFLWLFLTVGIMENESFLSPNPSKRTARRLPPTPVRNQVLRTICRHWITNTEVFKGEHAFQSLNNYAYKKY